MATIADRKHPIECPRFNRCSAPLCPLDENLNNHTWYIGEEICRAHGHNHMGIIKLDGFGGKRAWPAANPIPIED